MAHTRALSIAISLSLVGAAPLALTAEPSPAAAASDCAIGGSGADAIGNDCGALVQSEFVSRFHSPALARAIRPAAAAPEARRPSPTPAPRPAANRPEGQIACATAGGGADSTGNDCNGLARTATLATTFLSPPARRHALTASRRPARSSGFRHPSANPAHTRRHSVRRRPQALE